METPNFMDIALEEAQIAADNAEVPVGAVIVSHDGEIIARANNAMRQSNDPTAHAEIIALREAAKMIGNERLTGCDLYVTLEPCTMCAGAISHARIRRLYYGAPDSKMGAIDHGVRFFEQKTCHHAPEVIGGMKEQACADLLRDFFTMRRNSSKN